MSFGGGLAHPLRVVLDNPPDFYTNLDLITGHVIIGLGRPELLGAIVVKLEGESRTALAAPLNGPAAAQQPPSSMSGSLNNFLGRPSGGPSGGMPGGYPGGAGPGAGLHGSAQGGTVLNENHKILYRVSQVFPPQGHPAHGVPVTLPPGQHSFPFRFKLPFNNACSDPEAMARIGGLAGAGGYGIQGSAGLFGSGIRVMDGSRQLMYRHVTRTLPPSFTGFPGRAEVRYYVKVTVQRPGLLRENWREHLGFKFLPIEPPRPPSRKQEKQADGKNREAYARRPFAFQQRSPTPTPHKKRSSIFAPLNRKDGSSLSVPRPSQPGGSTSRPNLDAKSDIPPDSPSSSSPSQPLQDGLPPSIEMSARLPHPPILTCNQPIPLRLIARKLAPSREPVHLVSLQIDLVATTHLRCQNLHAAEPTRWVVLARTDLTIPLTASPDDPVDHEVVVPDALWRSQPLPNTVMPSFVACNLSREYSLEIRLGLSWGLPQRDTSSSFFGKGKQPALQPQAIFLPLTFSSVEVYSGLTPPPELVAAMTQQHRPPTTTSQPHQRPPQQQRPPSRPPQQQQQQQQHTQQGLFQAPPPHPAPPLPPRTSTAQSDAGAQALYPPQLQPQQNNSSDQDGVAPPYADAPPSYDEAMAAEMTGPVFPAGAPRPAYSGVTNENAPSTIPEKR